MPRLIDHRAREIELAEAAWRVVRRDGVRTVSVRTVAAEAGLATASLRRAFPTQAVLLTFCLDLVRERVLRRMGALPLVGTPREVALRILAELLPLDVERRAEMEVFLQIGTLALTDAGLRPVYDAAHVDLAAACRRVLDKLDAARELRPGLDLDRESRRLHALIDGLALHLIRDQPTADTGWAVVILGDHLQNLAAAGSVGTPPMAG